ncbi:MAG: ImmA/IrrE family metallo-endopeptidase [Bacilli bacterium]|nr:ImmA/IrrE family metallo-endopeptidase [Bacilli bacterium]
MERLNSIFTVLEEVTVEFNGNKLKELRLLKGWSRFELANLLGISEQAVWQFEIKNLKPDSSTTMLELLKIFDVSITYFEKADTLDVVNVGSIAFRNGDSSSKKSIQIQRAYINKVHSIFKYLEGYLIPPQSKFLVIQKNVSHYQEIGMSLEEIANFTKSKLGVSTDNHDLLFKIECSGINVLSKIIDIDKNADAYSLWTTDNVPYIVLGKGKSAVRRNFDLAHELAHLLLHSHIDFEVLGSKELRQKEQEADRFASFFLLPYKIFKEKFYKQVAPKVSNPKSYISLKNDFNVSIQALEYRAYKLGYLTLEQNNYFYRMISRNGYKKQEPLDDILPIKSPGKISSILDMILKNKQISVRELVQSQGVTIKFLVEHLDLDKSFFNFYVNKEEDYGQVIELKNHMRRA